MIILNEHGSATLQKRNQEVPKIQMSPP